MWNSENVSPGRGGGGGCGRGATREAAREVRRLAARPPPGVKLLLREDDLTDVHALIEGPAGTPYAGGVFRVRLALGREFPAAPPRAYFETRVFHPNVGRSGEVCVDTLKRDWRPELGLAHALTALRCLLIAPNPDSALNADAAALLQRHYDDYFARAKLLTDIHARPAASAAASFASSASAAASAATAASDEDALQPRDRQKDESAANADGAGEGAAPDSAAGAPPGTPGTGGTPAGTGGTPAGTGGTAGGTGGTAAGGEEPRAKRERRPRDEHKPAPARDKRRTLKRL